MANTKTKTVSGSVTEIKTEESTVKAKTVSKDSKAESREYNAEDLIPCRSLTQGELILPGKRSGITYRWFAIGEVVEVEYQDLLALNSRRSSYLYGPHFIIEDEELLAQPRWKGLSPIYQKLCNEQDMDEILDLAPAQLKQSLLKFPDTYKKALAIEVATRIENGTYDSINRIKVFDEVLGTDLLCLVK